ncbi:MAG: hypothetical protein JXQ73_07505 [Phycisphaerae bacterium]|nr:hypothetical protein [Phycisphaerae bacterium]
MDQTEMDQAAMSTVLLVHHATLSALGKEPSLGLLVDTMQVIRDVAARKRTLTEGQGELAVSGIRDEYEKEFGPGFEQWVAEQRKREQDAADLIAGSYARLLLGES